MGFFYAHAENLSAFDGFLLPSAPPKISILQDLLMVKDVGGEGPIHFLTKLCTSPFYPFPDRGFTT